MDANQFESTGDNKKQNISNAHSMYPPHSDATSTSMAPPYPVQQQPGVPYGTPTAPYYPNQQPQQQQVFIVGAHPTGPTTVIVANALNVSMVGAIVLSCFVYWCCGWLFGGIAFVLSMVGHSSAASGDTQGAIRLRNISYGFSIAGIIVGVIIIAVVLGVSLSAAAKTVTYCTYTNNGYTYNTC